MNLLCPNCGWKRTLTPEFIEASGVTETIYYCGQNMEEVVNADI